MEREHKHRTLLSKPYIEVDEIDVDWVKYVNTPMREGELHIVWNSVNRQAPLGDEKWQVETATKHGYDELSAYCVETEEVVSVNRRLEELKAIEE